MRSSNWQWTEMDRDGKHQQAMCMPGGHVCADALCGGVGCNALRNTAVCVTHRPGWSLSAQAACVASAYSHVMRLPQYLPALEVAMKQTPPCCVCRSTAWHKLRLAGTQALQQPGQQWPLLVGLKKYLGHSLLLPGAGVSCDHHPQTPS